MNIIDLQLQFDTDNLSLGNTPKYIGLHHSGGIGTVNAYHEMHKNKGWAGLGYNFFVDLNGKIYKGRPIEFIPAGILNHNKDSLHICANGDFENMFMPHSQCESIKKLILYCINLHPTITNIYGHKELMETDCPGKNFPLNLMKNILTNFVSSNSSSDSIILFNNKVLTLQHILNVMNIKDCSGNSLAEDGLMGPCTIEALSKILVRRGDMNPLVGWIQEQLGATVDNIYGDYPFHDTYDRILKFQKDNHLEADGIVGINTFMKLI